MKNAILIHGCCDRAEFDDAQYPSASNSHWFPWLQKQLLKKGIMTQTPEMPHPYNPEYQEWCKIFNQFEINHETTLVGHSCGAGFLMRWLLDNEILIDKLILVAPWLDPIKSGKGFLDFEINSALANKVKEIHIFYSSDDHVRGVKESVDIITAALPTVQVHHFDDRGHFTFEDIHTIEFPELLNVILEKQSNI